MAAVPCKARAGRSLQIKALGPFFLQAGFLRIFAFAKIKITFFSSLKPWGFDASR